MVIIQLIKNSIIVSDDWNSGDAIFDESVTMARVLAISQQEFFDSVKQNANKEFF